MSKQLPDYLVLMNQEYDELTARSNKLFEFINSEKYQELGPVEGRLLDLQFSAMLQYIFFLEQRIYLSYKKENLEDSYLSN